MAPSTDGRADGLAVEHVTVRYGERVVLDGVSVTVAAGETVGLLGPSGSCKSTLLRAVAGLVPVDDGRVLIGGHDVTALPTHRRGVGMVFQHDHLFPHLDVAGNIEFGLRMAGMSNAARASAVGELLELVGLAGFERRRVTELSGGERRRVALARSLAPSPRALLLDEPLTGLDRELHERLLGDVATILERAATAALWVTHDPDEAARIADRVVLINELSNGG